MVPFRLKISGKIFLILLAICIVVVIYLVGSSQKRKLPRLVSTKSTATPSTPGLSQFGRQEEKQDEISDFVDRSEKNGERKRSVVQPQKEVEIWGKASIADYLWGHIIGGNTTTYANGLLAHGEITLDDMLIRYRSGPGIIPSTVPSTVKYLVLVLNGKDSVKVKFARSWLDYLVHFRYLSRVVLVMLGSEQCDNDWLRPYLRSQGGLIDVVFLVYDSPLVDMKEVFQWPLGVATYRGFPQFRSDQMNIRNQRKHLCNFLGTVYRNSSRESLVQSISNTSLGKKCEIQIRDSWSPSETFASMDKYIRTVSESDLTLSPVGKNTECYRIYEALALGSVPVVEDVMTPGKCDSPLRLLKAHKAPLLYLKSWSNLPALLEADSKLSLKTRVERRKNIVEWYENFKRTMKNLFLLRIRHHFSGETEVPQ